MWGHTIHSACQGQNWDMKSTELTVDLHCVEAQIRAYKTIYKAQSVPTGTVDLISSEPPGLFLTLAVQPNWVTGQDGPGGMDEPSLHHY